VGPSRGARTLAGRLVDAGIADPLPPPSPLPTVAIVVPVRDDAAGLAATLAALEATAPGVRVVVVDDGSEPPLDEPLGPAVELVRRPVAGGPAVARNTGLARVEAEVVVFVDAGCVPAPGWPPALLGHFADPEVAAVAPRVHSRPGDRTPAALARFEAARSPLDLGPHAGAVGPGGAVPYVPSAVLAVRARALRQEGGFDEDLRFGEDVDLVWRLGRGGRRIRYEPAASASHPARPDLSSWLRQRYDYGRSAAPLAARHGRAVAPLSASPWSVVAWSLAACGWPAAGASVVAGTAWALGRRAGADPTVAAELRRLALVGNLRAGGAIAAAVRRAWLPPAVASGWLAGRLGGRRSRRSLILTALAIGAGPGLVDWWKRRPGAGPVEWMVWRLADDLAYQAGVWAGVARSRSAGALWPRW
jgi:mycofactocin system glycosyltransferase